MLDKFLYQQINTNVCLFMNQGDYVYQYQGMYCCEDEPNVHENSVYQFRASFIQVWVISTSNSNFILSLNGLESYSNVETYIVLWLLNPFAYNGEIGRRKWLEGYRLFYSSCIIVLELER